MIKKGDYLVIKPEWRDAGDEAFIWVARSEPFCGAFLWVAPRSPVAAALCVNSHNLPGRDVLSLRSSRLSRLLPRLGPLQMAGSFAARVASRPASPGRR